MGLPPLDKSDPVFAHRLETFDELGNAQVNKGIFYIQCGECGFSGWDGFFTAWPDQAFEKPSDLIAFAEKQAKLYASRKCPECHEMARLQGLRLFFMAASLQRDLVVEHEAKTRRTEFVLVDGHGLVTDPAPQGDLVRSACLDACLRAGAFIAEVSPHRDADARRLLTHVSKARPDDADAWLALARLEMACGDSDAALLNLREAAKNAGEDIASCIAIAGLTGELALSLTDANLLTDAIHWYEQAQKRAPREVRIRLSLGRLLVQSGNFDEAREHLEAARNHPVHAMEGAYLLGVLALHVDQAPEAVAIFADLAEQAPGDANVFHMLAWAHAKEGRRSDAEAALDQAAVLSPGSDETEYFRNTVEEELEALSE